MATIGWISEEVIRQDVVCFSVDGVSCWVSATTTQGFGCLSNLLVLSLHLMARLVSYLD